MSGVTDNPSDECIKLIRPDGQQECYLVLPESERSKGFVRPVRTAYQHVACQTMTTMGVAIAETYARDPSFYGGTFCVHCGKHYRLVIEGEHQFAWLDRYGITDGSYVGE